MRRYVLRDDQWDRIKDMLPGRQRQRKLISYFSALRVRFGLKTAAIPSGPKNDFLRTAAVGVGNGRYHA